MEPEPVATQPQPTLPPTVTPTPPVSPVIPPSKPKSRMVLLVGGILILGLGFTIGLLFNKNLSPISQISPTPISSATPVPSIDPTANWKTYVNYKENISFNYPQNWTQREYDKERVVVGDDQTVSVTIFFGIYSPVAIETPTPNKIIEEWFKYNIGSTAQFPDGGKVLSKDTIKVSGLDSTKYILVNNAVSPSQSFQRTWIFVQNNNRVTLLDNQGADNKLFDQILSTFTFIDPISVTTPTPQPLPTKVSGILSTTDWKLVFNDRVAFKIPNYASCDNDVQCSTITYTNYYQGTPSPLPAKITVSVTDYRGGSRRQQYLDINKNLNECKPLFVDSLFGGVNALQIPIDGGWCQGGYIGGIVSVVGNKFVVIGPSLTYNDNKEISRWDVRDTLVSTLSLITE